MYSLQAREPLSYTALRKVTTPPIPACKLQVFLLLLLAVRVSISVSASF